MTRFEEYQGKNQRLGYLIQLLSFFVTMNKVTANPQGFVLEQKLTEKIKQLAQDELAETGKLKAV